MMPGEVHCLRGALHASKRTNLVRIKIIHGKRRFRGEFVQRDAHDDRTPKEIQRGKHVCTHMEIPVGKRRMVVVKPFIGPRLINLIRHQIVPRPVIVPQRRAGFHSNAQRILTIRLNVLEQPNQEIMAWRVNDGLVATEPAVGDWEKIKRADMRPTLSAIQRPGGVPVARHENLRAVVRDAGLAHIGRLAAGIRIGQRDVGEISRLSPGSDMINLPEMDTGAGSQRCATRINLLYLPIL